MGGGEYGQGGVHETSYFFTSENMTTKKYISALIASIILEFLILHFLPGIAFGLFGGSFVAWILWYMNDSDLRRRRY
jgi:hypothetical protein